MVCCPGSGEDSLYVDMFHPGVVLVSSPVNVSQKAAHGVEDCLRSTGVPLLTAGAGEDVGAGLALHQEDHLVPGPAHLQHPVRLQDVEGVLDQPRAVAPGGGDDPLGGGREGGEAGDSNSLDSIESPAQPSPLLCCLVVVVGLVDDPG